MDVAKRARRRRLRWEEERQAERRADAVARRRGACDAWGAGRKAAFTVRLGWRSEVHGSKPCAAAASRAVHPRLRRRYAVAVPRPKPEPEAPLTPSQELQLSLQLFEYGCDVMRGTCVAASWRPTTHRSSSCWWPRCNTAPAPSTARARGDRCHGRESECPVPVDLLRRALRGLRALGARHALAGDHAVSVRREPCFTRDTLLRSRSCGAS